MAEGAARSGAAGHRERLVAGAMAVAGRDAALPSTRKRIMGSPDESADEKDGAGDALPLPRAPGRPAGFIKKTRATPDDDLALARKRQKELER